MSLGRTVTIALLIIAYLENAAAKRPDQSIIAYDSAVATDDGRCSKIGMIVLRQGGNAIDASVAAALCLGVVSPASSGIGGGAFTMVKIAGGKAIAYDSRETAPLLATENMYGGNAVLKKKGALSVGVPGEVAGLFTAWRTKICLSDFILQLIPNQIFYENWTTPYNDHFEIPKETRDVLEKKGHVLLPFAGGAISQFIVESGGNSSGMSKLVAVSDPRKGGFPSGY